MEDDESMIDMGILKLNPTLSLQRIFSPWRETWNASNNDGALRTDRRHGDCTFSRFRGPSLLRVLGPGPGTAATEKGGNEKPSPSGGSGFRCGFHTFAFPHFAVACGASRQVHRLDLDIHPSMVLRFYSRELVMSYQRYRR